MIPPVAHLCAHLCSQLHPPATHLYSQLRSHLPPTCVPTFAPTCDLTVRPPAIPLSAHLCSHLCPVSSEPPPRPRADRAPEPAARLPLREAGAEEGRTKERAASAQAPTPGGRPLPGAGS